MNYWPPHADDAIEPKWLAIHFRIHSENDDESNWGQLGWKGSEPQGAGAGYNVNSGLSPMHHPQCRNMSF